MHTEALKAGHSSKCLPQAYLADVLLIWVQHDLTQALKQENSAQ